MNPRQKAASLLGRAKSKAKTEAARKNGLLGGRPRTSWFVSADMQHRPCRHKHAELDDAETCRVKRGVSIIRVCYPDGRSRRLSTRETTALWRIRGLRERQS